MILPKYYTFLVQFVRALKRRGYCHAYKSCSVLLFCSVERARHIECTRSRFEFLKIMYEPREKIRNSSCFLWWRKMEKTAPRISDALSKLRRYHRIVAAEMPLKHTQDLGIQANLIRHESI